MFIDPGFSGADLERPAMEQLIDTVEQKKIDVVLVTKLDRLSRSQKDTLYLIEELFLPNGVDFVSVAESFDTTTSFGRAMVGILSVFAQLEREVIKERTFDGRRGRAKKGDWHGGGPNPIGYDYVEGSLVINEKEAEQVRMVYELYASGVPITSICDRMEGHTTKHGDWHHPGTVANVLDNPLYAGTIHFDDVKNPGKHTPIISKDLFGKVAAMRENPNKRHNKDSKYLLSGLVYCGNCGARYFAKTSPNGKRFYCCHSRSKVNKLMVKDPRCKNRNWPLEELEKVVYNEVLRLSENPHEIYSIKKRPQEGGHKEEVHIEIDRLNSEIYRLMDLYKQNDSIAQVEDVAQQIDSLYQEKVRLLNQSKSNQNNDVNSVSNYSVDHARLLIADLPAAMLEGKKEYVRYSLMRILDRIIVGDESVHFLWSFAR